MSGGGADGFSYQVHGLSALEAQLVALEDVALAVDLLAKAGRKAMQPVLDSARALVPRRSGDLYEAIKLSIVTNPGGDIAVAIGLRIGRAPGQSASEGEEIPSRRWHFIEFGTAHQAAHPFLRPALDRNVETVIELLRVELARLIAEAVEE